jgi:hypothetical protein
MRSTLLLVIVFVLGTTTFARADLLDAFGDFNAVWGIDQSGRISSYHADTADGLALTGTTTGGAIALLDPQLVSYPSGVGPVPSPGGAIGRQFDQGALGINVANDRVYFQLATTLDPRSAYYHNGWGTWYGQGDLFVDVADSGGVRHYALLNTWARDDDDSLINLNRGHFNAARDFHVSGGTGGASLEGHLIALDSDDDVAIAGGRGAYNPNNAPTGLDLRVYAAGGSDLGDGSLSIETISHDARDWYVQGWDVPLTSLSADATFDLGLHAAASCGNDQIGSMNTVPEPAALTSLLVGGLALFALRRRA